MIAMSKISASLPVVDINRAKKFYGETLGLKLTMEEPYGVLYESREGSNIFLYQRSQTKADHTAVMFQVQDFDLELNELRRKGVKFEEYDMPEMGIKTVNGVSTYKTNDYESKTAWFKDTEGNILALVSMVKVGPEGRRPEREPVGARR
jgi:predicted enzyme related to lactoylglutathione lyase